MGSTTVKEACWPDLDVIVTSTWGSYKKKGNCSKNCGYLMAYGTYLSVWELRLCSVQDEMNWIEWNWNESIQFGWNRIECAKEYMGNKMILCTSRLQVETSCFVSDLFCGFLFHIHIPLGILSVYNFIPMYVRRTKSLCKRKNLSIFVTFSTWMCT